jgi:hypothetical protein
MSCEFYDPRDLPIRQANKRLRMQLAGNRAQAGTGADAQDGWNQFHNFILSVSVRVLYTLRRTVIFESVVGDPNRQIIMT